MSLKTKIDYLISNSPKACQDTLKEIILRMLNVIKYINGDMLERHNWGGSAKTLSILPDTQYTKKNYEEDLLKCLDDDANDQAIIELLWGDVQLGKRVHACIIMWFSVYILERPVFYIFRNLTIDKDQLLGDINNMGHTSFNGVFIRSVFEKNADKIRKLDPKIKINTVWKKYVLPRMNDMVKIDEDMLSAANMYCCLMNYKQLEKLNSNFTEYIYNHRKLVNFTLIVDESDLAAPTSSNDKSSIKDLDDTTHCERLLAKIYKKVKYVLQITGTVQSLLYNITTRISEHTSICVMPSKIHKMRRTNDYYGLFSICDVVKPAAYVEPEEGVVEQRVQEPRAKINIDTDLVVEWWKIKDASSKSPPKYTILADYEVNIKKLITTIISRKNVKYNSLLISEEKTRVKQFGLVNVILRDFADVFAIIYHGKKLRLYTPEKYAEQLINISIDSHNILTELIIDTHTYFDIETDGSNIKMIYKLLRILFDTDTVKNKTVITITGKYGERGYSFVSDDYKDHSFHLTDQYLVSHSTINCTDISQRVRLQGKYNTPELVSGKMKLTLWTTKKVKTILDFYIEFMYNIEKECMKCRSYDEILAMLNSIIEKHKDINKYFKFLDAKKKLKNFAKENDFDKKAKGFRVGDIGDNECINELSTVELAMFKDKFGIWTYDTECSENIFKSFIEYETFITVNHIPRTRLTKDETGNFYRCSVKNEVKIYKYDDLVKELPKNTSSFGFKNIDNGTRVGATLSRLYVGYTDLADHNTAVYVLRLCKILDRSIKMPPNTTDYINKRPYKIVENTVIYSEIKPKFIDKVPTSYYWKHINGSVYQHNPELDKDNPKVNIRNISKSNSIAISSISKVKSDHQQLSVDLVSKFNEKCCKKSPDVSIRIGIKDLYAIYKAWCVIQKTLHLPMARFKATFESIGNTELKTRGFSVEGKPKARGYNILVEI
jgi:hypothetical protein